MACLTACVDSPSAVESAEAIGDGGAASTGRLLGPPRGEPLEFDRACVGGERIVVGAIGDVIVHSGIQRQSLEEGASFGGAWRPIEGLLESADIMYGNLEGVVSCCTDSDGVQHEDPGRNYDGEVYTAYPTFNYPASLVDGLVETGFDVVSTANNHAMDRFAHGADKTIEHLERVGLAYTGTRHRESPRTPWYTLTNHRGFSVAWLACTMSTNGIPDDYDQVLYCDTMQSEVLRNIRELRERDDIDAVIVTPHAGYQWEPKTRRRIERRFRKYLDAGADAVLASHPHTIQNWEKYRTWDGREGFIFYSLGNFVTTSWRVEKRSTVLLFVGFTRQSNGDVVINGVRFVPLLMQRDDGKIIQAPADDAEGADRWFSRSITVGRLSRWNVQPADQAIVTNPQCSDAWEGPSPVRGWVGDGCDADDNCRDGLTCDTEMWDGFCKTACETDEDCPVDEARGAGVCATHAEESYCMWPCSSTSDCRLGYTCQELPAPDGDVVEGCAPEPEEDEEED